jgi:gas vesicle protein
MSENDNDLGAFLAGFVIGGLVGAATALILAPQSGEETRTQIADKSRELRETSEERMQQYRQAADDFSQEYRGKAEQAIADARGRAEEAGGRVQEQARIVLDAGKDRVSQVKEQIDTKSGKDDEQVGGPADGDEAAAS